MLSTAPASADHSRPYRVLVVEDEALVAMLISDQLAELGHSVVGPAFSLSEARLLAAAACADVLLVDLNLRGEYSGEVVDILASRKIRCAQPLDERYADITVLNKPFLTDDLQRAIAQVMPAPG